MPNLQKQIQAYFDLNSTQVQSLDKFFNPSYLKKGDFLLEKDKPCVHLSFIHQGYLRVFAYQSGKEITQWIASPGEFVSELSSFIFKAPSRFYIQALSDCELYSIRSSDYQRLHEYLPNWPEIEKGFLCKCFIHLENRVFRHLSLSAEERYEKLFQDNKALFNQVPLHYLASMLGMSPETFSRIRHKRSS